MAFTQACQWQECSVHVRINPLLVTNGGDPLKQMGLTNLHPIDFKVTSLVRNGSGFSPWDDCLHRLEWEAILHTFEEGVTVFKYT